MVAVASNPKCYHLSASSIAAFKACPTRFRLQYREGLRTSDDTDSQRVGTNWHAMHEEYARVMADNGYTAGVDSTINDAIKEVALNAVVYHLNKRYERIPTNKTAEEWAVERITLLNSFIGYHWYWQNDPVEALASEVPFNLPLHYPRTGMPLSMEEVQRVGKIDHVIRWQGAICALERKSTSRSIDADSDYWDKAKKDTQVSMYALAFRDLAQDWDTENHPDWASGKVERYGNTLYDVWHKPTIKPTFLTQEETRSLIDTGTYCNQAFQVELVCRQDDDPELCARYTINGMVPERKVGKKGFAIRETPDMYGARLLADIMERPEFYFARREIARTDAELDYFRKQLFAVYQAQKMYEKTGAWFENESQCRATFPCPYIPICYGDGADAVCDGSTTPNGFKRIFVDMTVNGQATEE